MRAVLVQHLEACLDFHQAWALNVDKTGDQDVTIIIMTGWTILSLRQFTLTDSTRLLFSVLTYAHMKSTSTMSFFHIRTQQKIRSSVNLSTLEITPNQVTRLLTQSRSNYVSSVSTVSRQQTLLAWTRCHKRQTTSHSSSNNFTGCRYDISNSTV